MSEIEVPKGWELKKLFDVCKQITSGGTPNRGNSSYFGGNIQWLKIGDLNERMIFDSEEKITEQGLKNSSAKIFPKNTVLLAMYGATIGKTGILGKECATNQAICGLIHGNLLNPNYLLYFLQSRYHEIRAKAEGAAQPNINQYKIKNMDIPLPSLETQKKIVQKLDHVLGQLEEKKKEILERINKFNSKQLHDAYRYHLLNLAFNGKLTCEKYVYSENDQIKIPKGWKKENLYEQIENFEKRNPIYEPDIEFKYVEIGSVDSEKKICNFKKIQGKNAPSRARNVIRKNDVIYGTTRPYYRNIVLIPSEFDNEICSTGFCVLRAKNNLNSKFLFYFMLSDYANNQILKPMRGVSYPAVSNKDVISIKIPLPPLETQKKIVQILDKKFQEWDIFKPQIENIEKQYQHIKKSIANISNSILNSAFSGKLVN